MEHFTLEESQPSLKTLNLIRQVAHAYRTIDLGNGRTGVYCLN